MMPLYDQSLSLIINSLAIRAIANDKDLNLKPIRNSLIKRLANKIKSL